MAYVAPVPITHSTIAGNVPNESGESAPGALSLNISDRALYTRTYGGAVVRIGSEQGNASLASAATVDASHLIETFADVTGSTDISAITLDAGQTITLRFTAALTLLHGSTLVLLGGASLPVSAGDFATFRGYVGGVSRCTSVNFGGGTAFPPGTALLPSISARGDLDTGMWFPLANTIGFSTNGVERLRINENGDLAIASGKRLYLDYGSDTYLVESAANVIDMYVGGVMALRMATTGAALAGHVTFEGVTSTGATGSGKLVFDTNPTLVNPALGTPSALVGTNISGTAVNLTAGNSQKLGGLLPADYAPASHGHDYSHTHTVTISGTTYTTSSAP